MIRNLAIKLLNYFLALFSYIVPKKKGFLLFIPLHHKNIFSGNIKALILYAQKNYSQLNIKLLTVNEDVKSRAEGLNLNVISKFYKIPWAILRAEHLIIDRSSELYHIGRFSIVQLWHGTGFKNVGLMNENLNSSKKEIQKHFNKYDLIVASSEADVEKSNDSFGVKNAVITGLPRNDIFFEQNELSQSVKLKYKLDKYSEIITYAPTFRDFKTIPPFTPDFWKKLDNYLIENNAIFIIKKHPWSQLKIDTSKYKNIVDLSKKIVDVQELLLITDVLISDYSSIITDFSITERPILIYAYDLDLYLKKCRSIYYDIEEILPKPFISDENELLNKLKSREWIHEAKIENSYEEFKNKFHYYLDGNASKRVMDAILKL